MSIASKHRVFTVLLIFCAATFGLFTTAMSAGLAEHQVLNIGTKWGNDLSTRDPLFLANGSDFVHARLVYNGLVKSRIPGMALDMRDMEGVLAESWEVSDDLKTWTFYLRKGVEFHQAFGEFTAEDVKFTMDRYLDQKLGSPYGGVYQQYVDEVVVVDSYTVVFKLISPYADFLALVSLGDFSNGYIVSKKAAEYYGNADGVLKHSIGTGPFMESSHQAKEKVTYVRNPSYFKGIPILEEVVMHFMPDTASRTIALKTGAIDMTVGPMDPSWCEQRIKEGFIVDLVYVECNLHMNMTYKPLNDLTIRQAIAYGINRDEIQAYYKSGDFEMARPIYSLIPTYVGYNSLGADVPANLRYSYNPQRAKELLEKAGYPNGFEINAVITPVDEYRVPLEIIKAQLEKIGIDVNMIQIDHTSFHARIRKDESSLVPYSGGRAPLAEIFLRDFFYSDSIVGTPTAVANFSHYGAVDANGDGSIDSIDDLGHQALTEGNLQERKRLYDELQIQLLEDLPAYPVVSVGSPQVRAPYVVNAWPSINDPVGHYLIDETTRILKH